MPEERFLAMYGKTFPAFCVEPDCVVRLFNELKSALSGTDPLGGVKASKVTRILTTWCEKMLYILSSLLSSPSDSPTGSNMPETESSSESNANKQAPRVLTARISAVAARQTDRNGEAREISFRSAKMKDILAMPELKSYLGEDIIYLLRMLMGPLHSVNLRNLLWHGFFAGHEFPVFFAALIFAILLSLGLLFMDIASSTRYQKMMSQVSSSLSFFNGALLRSSPVLRGGAPLARIVPIFGEVNSLGCGTSTIGNGIDEVDASPHILDIVRSQRQKIVQLIKDSPFCLNGFKKEWIHALDLIILPESHTTKYFEAMTVLFPLLEASLRKAYVDCNNIQSFRLAAEPDALCLSLDLILEDWLEREILIQDRRVRRQQRRMELENLEDSTGVPQSEQSEQFGQRKSETNKEQNASSQNRSHKETSTDESDMAGDNIDNKDHYDPLQPETRLLEDEADYEEDDYGELAEVMQEDGKRPNLLFAWLGPQNTAILFDILIWADTIGIGRHYRPRDQMAHGSAIPSEVSLISAIHLLLTVLNLMQHSPPALMPSEPSNLTSSQDDPFNLHLSETVSPPSETDSNGPNNTADPSDFSCILKMAKNFGATYQPTFHKKRSTIDTYQSLKEYVSHWQSKYEGIFTPLSRKLMLESIEKELKPEEREWIDASKSRYLDLRALRDQFRSSVDRVARLSTEDGRRRDTYGLFPISTPMTISCYSQTAHCMDLLLALRHMLEDMIERFRELNEGMNARTLWLTNRRNFGCMWHALPTFGVFAEIVLEIVREILSHDHFATTANIHFVVHSDVPTFIWSCVERITALNSKGKFKNGEEVLASLLATAPLSPKFLPTGESYRCWLDVNSYIDRIERRFRGETLERDDIWKHPRNAEFADRKRVLYGGIPFDARNRTYVTIGRIEYFLLERGLGSIIDAGWTSSPKTMLTVNL